MGERLSFRQQLMTENISVWEEEGKNNHPSKALAGQSQLSHQLSGGKKTIGKLSEQERVF